MPTARSWHSICSNTSGKRLPGGAGLESFLQVTRIELKPGNTEEEPQSKRTVCPATPCEQDFWWAPKQRKSQRAQKKLEEELQKPYTNVMSERRVIRGPNFGRSLMDDVDPFDRSAYLNRQKALRRISDKYNCKMRNQRNVIGTVPPVAGRAHLDVQTDKYLEELVAEPPAYTAETQTDLFLERPPIPPYKPAKVGVDASTEIGDGELFHFDAEAQPIIDVLVDGAIEQSILDVAHEQEIGAIRAKQGEYLSKREAELAELRRLENEELRLQAEKARRIRQDEIAREMDAEMQRAVVAAKFLQGHISSLLPEIWENLEPASDAAKKNYLLQTLCPWLCKEVKMESKHIVQSRNILDSMIGEFVRDRGIVYGDYREVLDQPLPPQLDEGEEADGLDEICSCESTDTKSIRTIDICGPNDKKV